MWLMAEVYMSVRHCMHNHTAAGNRSWSPIRLPLRCLCVEVADMSSLHVDLVGGAFCMCVCMGMKEERSRK